MFKSISKVFPFFVWVFLGDVWNNNLSIMLFYTLSIVVESL
jgi:hypothetical protein